MLNSSCFPRFSPDFSWISIEFPWFYRGIPEFSCGECFFTWSFLRIYFGLNENIYFRYENLYFPMLRIPGKGISFFCRLNTNSINPYTFKNIEWNKTKFAFIMSGISQRNQVLSKYSHLIYYLLNINDDNKDIKVLIDTQLMFRLKYYWQSNIMHKSDH